MTDVKLYQSGELDMAYDNSFEADAATLARDFGVYVKVVEQHGPSGGWPIVRLCGTAEAIEKAVRTAWDCGDAEENTRLVTLALIEAEPLDS